MTEEMHIQVESNGDMEYVMGMLSKHIMHTLSEQIKNQQQSSTENGIPANQQIFCQELLGKEIDNMWRRLAPNIHINGMEWQSHDLHRANEQFEPLQEDLIQELAKYQNSFENILYRLITCRNSLPEQIQQNIRAAYHEASSLSSADDALALDQNEQSELADQIISKKFIGAFPSLNILQEDISILDKIVKTMPEYSEKLNRACTVLTEEQDIGERRQYLRQAAQVDSISPSMTEEEQKQYDLAKRISITQAILNKINPIGL